ncbi:glycosyltransferase family 2 protein [Roseibium salinum]
MEHLPEKGLLVLSGPWGLAIRKLETDNGRRTLGQWWANYARKLPELRDFLISDLGGRTALARAAVSDLQSSEPLPAKRHGVLGDVTPFCSIETALTSEDGVLVGGWLRDPAGMYVGLDLIDPSGEAHPLSLHSFDGVLPDSQGGHRIKRFVAYAPVAKSLQHHLQPRFDLRLASGESFILIPPPQPGELGDIRAKALSVVPPRHATDQVMEECLSRPFADLQSRVKAAVGAPVEVSIGTPVQDPAISIVIPVYRVLEFLKAQIAAFAADSWLAEHAEVLFVLDSPEQATQVEDLLAGFHLLYGLPVRLIVMDRNAGYAHACNAGAALARGRYLAMVNSDVVPVQPGWLEQLCAGLLMDEHVGAVGAKLLYADNSIQHAGLKFIQDEKGRWFNHHYFKGFPRLFPQAGVSREVPGVTGACLVLSKADFDEVGGFTTDYIIGDYEDSDLCLKIRRLNRRIYYLSDVELYHFERISIKKSADYTRGVASQYNRWLHQSRWQQDMEYLMSAPGAQDGMTTS